MNFNVLQMAGLWLPQTGTLYLPPAPPVSRILTTDEYVVETSVFFHASSDRLVTVGHPYFPVLKPGNNTVEVPKVSGNQFRAFRLLFPDPNKFALIEKQLYNPETERLVWRLRGIDIARGGPLGIGSTGHPLMNKLKDTENPANYQKGGAKDTRQNVSLDPKQTQLFVVGCTPCKGEHWDVATACSRLNKGDCPPIQLVPSVIEDGNMCDIGFGAMNFAALQADRSGVPLDIVADTCKWPDFLGMANDRYGDSMFFFGRREQVYARHYFTHNGTVGDRVPEEGFEANGKKYFFAADNQQDQHQLAPSVYFATPSGSLASSDSQLFSRPYWLQRAQGPNNAIIWNNNLFVTLVDNTHNINFSINVATEDGITSYDSTKFKHYLRHVEEFEISVIVQLCKVPLTPDVLAHIHVMNPAILEEWQLGIVAPPSTSIETTYRYIDSLATKCPTAEPPKEKEDPYDKMQFWKVDLTDRMSSELGSYPLGRRFLHQTGTASPARSLKRARPSSPAAPTKSTSVKRRRKRL